MELSYLALILTEPCKWPHDLASVTYMLVTVWNAPFVPVSLVELSPFDDHFFLMSSESPYPDPLAQPVAEQ